ncbi:MAG: hypothetical protein NTX98_03005 [Candidatus Doudnabacteria bacterium]|nr:hypothetical protein [Candidatus Doudnabacteria bacterium]
MASLKPAPCPYLFLGPRGLGKKTLAVEFARKILGTENLSTHPDFQILEGEEEIVMQKARDLIASLSLKPFIAKKKVAIIGNAENLNTQSGNSLLKTLEEPSGSTVIILVSSKQLLPTIASRCQVFAFDLFSQKQLEAFAKAEKILIDERLANLSFGLPSRLLKFSQDPRFLEQEKELVKSLADLEKMGLGDKLLQVTKYAALEFWELERVFFTWLMWKVNNLNNDPIGFGAIRGLLDALIKIKQNQNKKLILQGLFLKI